MTADLSLHLVTDHRVPFVRLRDLVDEAVTAGVSVVQLRDKVASGAELFARTLDLADVIAGRCTFVIDDRLDIVLAARERLGAPVGPTGIRARVDGVHLGQSDLPVDAARALLGPDALIGWTANTPAHLTAAKALPTDTVDYLGVGVIRATSTKPDHPRPLGIDGFGELAASTPLPCVAIGGIGLDDVTALHRAGAAGVAVVSLVSEADDPGEIVRHLRAAWEDGA
ncbi:thiamine phosphate synthase [Microbacterium testaceum]|uniref:thiamine phosphate synthase n=1 Tax=Microbacterium testaceum TaxID=2033 RepID=UPI002434A11F|nr:thiamine phosphate synthase [Microbacterium testaceum]